MKTLLLGGLIALFGGSAVAWAINYNRYAYRQAKFGPFEIGGDVTDDNLIDHINLESDEALGKVELDQEPTYDFGVMSPGSAGEHAFRIKNVGEGDLRLRVGASTCKCTLGELDKEVLGPGEETMVTLSWKVLAGSAEFGQSAQLLTNDPSQVAITLKIVGQIVQDFRLVPEVWAFGEVATGEPIEIEGTIYNYTQQPIKPTVMKFSDDRMSELAEFDVEPFDPSAGDESVDKTAAKAIQGFRVKAKLAPGMPQGPISQNLLFGFRNLDEDGNEIEAEEGAEDSNSYLIAPARGRVVGVLGMLESSKLKGQPGGGYLYDFGRLSKDDSLIAKTFVVLKGNERDNVSLTIGQTQPDGVVRATLGEPKGRGSMVLYPLEIELIPGEEPIERLGKDRRDYGSIWIESDNPKVSKMRVALKFAIEGR